MAEGFIQRYEMGDTAPRALALMGDAWLAFLGRQFDIQVHRKYPFRYFHHRRLFTERYRPVAGNTQRAGHYPE